MTVEDTTALLEAVRNGTFALHQGLGPDMLPFLTSCYEVDAMRFVFIWATGFAAMVCTVIVAGLHRMEIQRRPLSMQRVYYEYVNVFPFVLGGAAVICLFCPRTFFLMTMFQEQAEAVALSAFGNILFMLCAEEASKRVKDMEGATVGQKMLVALNEEGEKPHFAAPPFTCCFASCMPARLLTPRNLILARGLIRQYAFVMVAGSMVAQWCSLSMPIWTAMKFNLWVGWLMKWSALFCIYGLFILYKATHHLLESWNPTAKFVSLKLCVFMMAWQEFIIKSVVRSNPSTDDKCLADTTLTGAVGKELQDHFRERFYIMYCVVLESILVAYMVRKAFPASELEEKTEEMHGRLLKFDLQRMVEWSSLGADSDESGSEDDRLDEESSQV